MKTKKMASSMWIVGGTVVTQNARRHTAPLNLRIEGGKIAEITSRTPKKDGKTPVLSAENLILVPGFVQTHVHLCQTLFRNFADDLELLDWLQKRIWKFEAAHNRESLTLSAEIGIQELLSGGTTTILDMGTVRHTDAVFEVATRLGIRANIGKCLMDHPQGTPPYLREPATQALSEAVQLFKKWNGTSDDRIRAHFAPRFALSCSNELLKGAAEAADALGAMIHTHACENQKEVAAIRKQTGAQSNLAHLDRFGLLGPKTVLAHCVWLSSKEESLLKSTGASISHCPSSNLKLASGIAPILKYLNQGIRVSLGADGAPCNNKLDMFEEIRLSSLLQKALAGPKAINAQAALDLATREGAKALGWFDQIGSLEVGKKADLFAIDLSGPLNLVDASTPEAIISALAYSAERSQIEWTLVDGRRVYLKNSALRRKQWATLGAEAMRSRALLFKRSKSL